MKILPADFMITEILKPDEFTAEEIAPLFWQAIAGPGMETPADLVPKKLASACYLLAQLKVRGVVIDGIVTNPAKFTRQTWAEIMWQEFAGENKWAVGNVGAKLQVLNQAEWMISALVARGILA